MSAPRLLLPLLPPLTALRPTGNISTALRPLKILLPAPRLPFPLFSLFSLLPAPRLPFPLLSLSSLLPALRLQFPSNSATPHSLISPWTRTIIRLSKFFTINRPRFPFKAA